MASRHTIMKMSKLNREKAIERAELREQSVPRECAPGITSFALKKVSEADRRLIDEALARRRSS